MLEHIQPLLEVVSCPDDRQSLTLAERHLHCDGCSRSFPIHDNQVVELLPSRPRNLPVSVSAEYRKAYEALFEEPFETKANCIAWGAPETAAEPWVRKRQRQVVAVQPLVTNGAGNSVLCDVAAGAGYYTFAYARHFRAVLHCDLSVDNLNYAAQKARRNGSTNVLFLRIDYFKPPFRQSLDRVLCLDTLIRGEAHDSLLLRAVAECLAPNGKAVVDFHNWWHNPLRRMGLLAENFQSNRSYSRAEIRRLLDTAAIEEVGSRPFIQEFDSGTWLDRTCSWAVPATRFLYEVKDGPMETRSSALAGIYFRAR
jgi:SAM-dependent methyltransferase